MIYLWHINFKDFKDRIFVLKRSVGFEYLRLKKVWTISLSICWCALEIFGRYKGWCPRTCYHLSSTSVDQQLYIPHQLWAEALSTESYLLNRSNKTSFEAWDGKKPYVKHLKAFGCVVYSHVPKDQRKKLDSKAKICIFLCYAAQRKGYRLYNVSASKVIHSRDVV